MQVTDSTDSDEPDEDMFWETVELRSENVLSSTVGTTKGAIPKFKPVVANVPKSTSIKAVRNSESLTQKKNDKETRERLANEKAAEKRLKEAAENAAMDKAIADNRTQLALIQKAAADTPPMNQAKAVDTTQMDQNEARNKKRRDRKNKSKKQLEELDNEEVPTLTTNMRVITDEVPSSVGPMQNAVEEGKEDSSHLRSAEVVEERTHEETTGTTSNQIFMSIAAIREALTKMETKIPAEKVSGSNLWEWSALMNDRPIHYDHI